MEAQPCPDIKGGSQKARRRYAEGNCSEGGGGVLTKLPIDPPPPPPYPLSPSPSPSLAALCVFGRRTCMRYCESSCCEVLRRSESFWRMSLLISPLGMPFDSADCDTGTR